MKQPYHSPSLPSDKREVALAKTKNMACRTRNARGKKRPERKIPDEDPSVTPPLRASRVVAGPSQCPADRRVRSFPATITRWSVLRGTRNSPAQR
ncbi:hypothetical protein PsYK624_151760 [Phanerochaete sordida]|uniref:Uncharacterized protein n=1 Tax=Phanerochaete sordida TaxID=48140 RepID=A0A9P3LKT0_9APHY|nr:hypothetical protein PsYK624_151760 [Phanerochaete sordida]